MCMEDCFVFFPKMAIPVRARAHTHTRTSCIPHVLGTIGLTLLKEMGSMFPTLASR